MAKLKGLLELMDEALEMDAAKEAVLRLGLQADNTAADRAKAIKKYYPFSDNKTYYHGTTKEIPSGFDFSMVGNRNVGSHGIHMTNNPLEAARHSQEYTGKGPDYMTQPDGSIFPKGANIIPLKVFSKNQTSSQAPYTHASNLTGDELKRVKDGKYDMVKIYGTRTNNWLHDHNHIESIKDGINSYPKSKNFPFGKERNTHIVANKGSLIRSPFAKFNPKKAGIPLLTGGAGGAFMSTNLLAAPSGQPEFREAPMSFLDKAKKYAADSYEYAANEGGPVGKFLYSGGAEALKDIEQGTTPMVKTGRLPAMPTGAALARLLELLQL